MAAGYLKILLEKTITSGKILQLTILEDGGVFDSKRLKEMLGRANNVEKQSQKSDKHRMCITLSDYVNLITHKKHIVWTTSSPSAEVVIEMWKRGIRLFQTNQEKQHTCTRTHYPKMRNRSPVV